MKVNDIIEQLAQYNPEAELKLFVIGQPQEFVLGHCMSGNGCNDKDKTLHVSINVDKLTMEMQYVDVNDFAKWFEK